jgi:hypothetical protein
MKITNKHHINLALAVWLLEDGYNSGADVAPEGELISATKLMKPTKQLILSRLVDSSQEEMDVTDMVASRSGHAFHDSIERAWTEGKWQIAMKKLKYSQKVINNMIVNPEPEDLQPGQIPVYLEKRGFREFEDIVLTGQLDFIIGKQYTDFKSTSTFAWTSGNKDQDYILQGSIYRWLFPDLITNDVMQIGFIFTDWARYRTSDPKYPQTRVTQKDFKLMSLEDTEAWISSKLALIRTNAKLLKKGQDKMEPCSDKELWRSEPLFKFYGDAAKAKLGGRSTKNFDSLTDAQIHQSSKNGAGAIVTIPGEVKACEYCPAFQLCEQRKDFFRDDGSRV